MKTRLWVLIIVLIVCLAAVSLYIGWQRTGVGSRVERQFRSRLEQYSGARVEFDEFRLGLGHVEIEGFSLRDRDDRYVLMAERLHLSLSLFDQLLGSMGFSAGIREIFANQPRLELDLDRLRQAENGGGGGLSGMISFLPQRITVSKGSIILGSSQMERTSRIVGLDGWLEEDQDGEGSFRCSGSWGSEVGNLIISGTYTDRLRGYRIQGELHQAALSEVLAPVLSPRYSYHRGRLVMTLQAVREPEDDRPHIGGQLSMEVGRLVDERIGIVLEDVRTRARMEGKDVIVEGAEARALGGVARAQGRIIDLLHPTTDLRISLREIDTNALWSGLLKEDRGSVLRGRANLEGRLSGPADDIRFQGHISAPALEVFGHTLTDLNGTVANKGFRIRIDELAAGLDWAEVGCRGELDLSCSPPAVLIDWRLEDIDLAAVSRGLPLNGIEGRGLMAGRIAGSIPDLHLRGGFQLPEVRGGWLPVEAVAGCFHWDGRRMSYRMTSTDGSLRLEGGSDGLSARSRQQALLYLNHVPAKGLLAVLPGRHAGSTIDGRWILHLTEASLVSVGQMAVETSGGIGGRMQASLSVTRPWDDDRRIEARVVSRDLSVGGLPLELSLQAVLDRNTLWLQKLSAGDGLNACGRIGLGGNTSLNGGLILSDVPLSRAAAFIRPALKRLALDGTLSGGFGISGTRDHPRMSGRVEVRDGQAGRLQGLSVSLPIRLANGRLTLDRTELFSEGHGLLTLEGFAENAERWRLLAHGREIKADQVTALLPESVGHAAGALQAVCRLEGPLVSPGMHALLRWNDGQLDDLTFDRLHAELRKSRDRWHLDRFTLESGDQRRIWASGTGPGDLFDFIPGRPSAESPELDVTIGADGEIISLLPSLTGMIDAAEGRGEMRIRLGGLPGELVVGSGHCHIFDAWIEPAVFIDRIDDLNGHMEVIEGDRFLTIEHLSGTVADRPLLIGNRRSAFHPGLESVAIPGLGLDLGIITVETGTDGVEVNVPGLMARGSAGQMLFCGKDHEGPLMISGPLEGPLVTGALILDHLEFTYPPMPTNGKIPLSFLALIRWDLLVEANNDVWYRNDYARLRLLENLSRLHFTGSAEENDLRVTGHAEADRGEITYLDRPFEVRELELDFEGQTRPSSSRPDNRPFVSGRFETTVYDESTGVATDIYLTLYTTDPQTGEKLSRGQWGDFELELSSNDPSDDDRQKILAKLGYSGDYSEKALQLLQVTLGPKLNQVFLRPVIQPVERTIRRALGIDVVRLQPGLTWNLLSQGESPPGSHQSLSRRLVFPRTTLLVGKYLTDNCFLSYLGQFQTRTDEFLDDRMGICHRFGLEYRLSGGTILDIEYDYERDLTEGDKRVKTTSDKRVQITHNFPF
jgi:hypothetical protein